MLIYAEDLFGYLTTTLRIHHTGDQCTFGPILPSDPAMSAAPSDENLFRSSDPAFLELVRYSSHGLEKKSLATPIAPDEPEHPSWAIAFDPFTLEPAAASPVPEHAPPLSPLRLRDLQAMADLFHQPHMDEIEADILRNLGWRFPEPCWEDDPLDFLNGD